ncbi:MAG: ACP S-malonyltransferase [Spirochaetaceae bacterium]|nr:ACP S-malonyltransferase [Spirochaetaceae bacterium]
MNYIFLYPGQGAQFQGMIKDVCDQSSEAREVLEKAEAITGEKISDWLWNIDATELARSDRSQLAITVASLALTAALKAKGIEADAFAGFSLGEFSALCSSGVLSFEDTITLVYQRGKIMQKACEAIANSSGGNPPGMAAVLGLPPETVIDTLKPLTEKGIAFAANMNSPKQTVVSATAEGIASTEELCKTAGARRVVRLKVAGPFHSPLMMDGAKEFEKVLQSVTFNNPQKTLFSNVTGKIVTTGEEAKKNAVLHFTHPVLWTTEEKEMSEMIQAKNTEYSLIEVGPGTVLTGLWRDSGYADSATCVSCNTVEHIQEITNK